MLKRAASNADSTRIHNFSDSVQSFRAAADGFRSLLLTIHSEAMLKLEHAKPGKGKDEQGGEETTGKLRLAKEPSKEAKQAYQLYFGSGMKQEDVAKKMSDTLKRPVSQGQVSRWVNEYKKWRKAEGIPVDDKKPNIISNTDILDMGARKDGRITGDPRHKKNCDYDNDYSQ